MKKFKLLTLFFAAFAALTLTSCLNDDDDNTGLTAEQIQMAYNATRGSHSGKIIYTTGFDKDGKDVKDSANVSWDVTSDTVMYINNVPSKVLASVIADDDIRAAVETQGPQRIKCYINYINVSPIQWLVNPVSVSFDNLEYNGAKHKVTIAFYANSNYSFGQLITSVTPNIQMMQFIAGALYVDDKINSEGINYLKDPTKASSWNSRMRYLVLKEIL
jgi:hypothetical protein